MSLGHDSSGKRIRRTVTGRTKADVRAKLDKLKDEINAGIRTPGTYTVEQCVRDWIDSLTLDVDTIASYRSQAQKWIYPRLGARKLKDLKATEVERFLNDLGKVLGKRSLMMIKSTLSRSIRRAQVHDLIRRNVAELASLPEGQPGRPSRAMTQEQAALCSPRQAASPPATPSLSRSATTPRPLPTQPPIPPNSPAAPSRAAKPSR